MNSNMNCRLRPIGAFGVAAGDVIGSGVGESGIGGALA
jgi:hypothetical protein